LQADKLALVGKLIL